MTATPSTRAGRPARVPTSARKCPAPCSVIWCSRPRPSRRITRTRPLVTRYIPRPDWPMANSFSPACQLCGVPKRRTRAISSAVSCGNIWCQRDSSVEYGASRPPPASAPGSVSAATASACKFVMLPPDDIGTCRIAHIPAAAARLIDSRRHDQECEAMGADSCALRRLGIECSPRRSGKPVPAPPLSEH
ncbi:hypothetical protein CBM2599_B51263 [Cupriavidus taiwanensis]|nr:hypothetical protein CBM2599_B51263 [Cupriavidus taiwanensis]